eukprot:576683-Pelagomonas_calceolata.AAC.4
MVLRADSLCFSSTMTSKNLKSVDEIREELKINSSKPLPSWPKASNSANAWAASGEQMKVLSSMCSASPALCISLRQEGKRRAMEATPSTS